jgi:L-rhamnose mutarotase
LRIALRTRVRAIRINEYETAHQEVPDDFIAAIRADGATEWTIYRSGQDLFHIIDCDDYDRLIANVGAQPINTIWQARMAEFLEVVHDYSTGSADTALPIV